MDLAALLAAPFGFGDDLRLHFHVPHQPAERAGHAQCPGQLVRGKARMLG
jgi:hypothetical protein